VCCARSYRNVVGVLESDRGSTDAVIDTVTAIALDSGARVTLAKTCDPGKLMRWLAPCIADALHTGEVERGLTEEARTTLARIAEWLPTDLCFQTIVLGPSTPGALRELVRSEIYDTLVLGHQLLARDPGLERYAHDHAVRIVRVSAGPTAGMSVPERSPRRATL